MKDMNRRSFFSAAASMVAATAFLGGCTMTKVGSVRTVTLNVKKVDAYVKAGVKAAATVTGIISTMPQLVAYAAPLAAASATLLESSRIFLETVGDKITVTYDDSSIKTKVDSILEAISQVLDIIGNVAKALVKAGLSVPKGIFNKIESTRASLDTVVAVFKAVLMSSFAAVDTTKEVAALNELGVRV